MFTIATLIETKICNCLSTMQFHSHFLKKAKLFQKFSTENVANIEMKSLNGDYVNTFCY